MLGIVHLKIYFIFDNKRIEVIRVYYIEIY